MKCSDCDKDAVVRVRVNGNTSVVCEDHRVAIVRRIEHVARKCWDGNKNLRAVLALAIQGIEFEDLVPGLRTPGGAIPLPDPKSEPM
jgi:hypothetical protein